MPNQNQLTVELMIQRATELAKCLENQQPIIAGYFREMASMAAEINKPFPTVQ
jgi:hypothetical protein